jgi:hypothetical protein
MRVESRSRFTQSSQSLVVVGNNESTSVALGIPQRRRDEDGAIRTSPAELGGEKGRIRKMGAGHLPRRYIETRSNKDGRSPPRRDMTHPHPVGLARKQNVGSEGWSGNSTRSPSPCPTRPPSIHPSYGTVEWWWAAGSAADHVDRLVAGWSRALPRKVHGSLVHAKSIR